MRNDHIDHVVELVDYFFDDRNRAYTIGLNDIDLTSC